MTDLNPHYADACERHRERVLAIPAMSVPDGDGGFIAAYRCPACDHVWTCSWATVPGRMQPPPASQPTAIGDLDLVRELRQMANRIHSGPTGETA